MVAWVVGGEFADEGTVSVRLIIWRLGIRHIARPGALCVQCRMLTRWPRERESASERAYGCEWGHVWDEHDVVFPPGFPAFGYSLWRGVCAQSPSEEVSAEWSG